jgi:hypothetical protein
LYFSKNGQSKESQLGKNLAQSGHPGLIFQLDSHATEAEDEKKQPRGVPSA